MRADKSTALRVAAGHRHFDHRAAPFCGIEKRFFADEGLNDITIGVTGADDNTVAALKAGAVDIGLDISPAKVLNEHLAGVPLVIIGSMANGVGQVLTGIRSLKSIEDLRGKRVNVVENGTGVDWHPLRLLLRRRGLDPDRDVILVPHAPYPLFKNALQTFEAGEADARMVLHVEVPHIIAAGYPVLFDFQAEYPPDYPQRTIVTTRAAMKKDPDRVNSFLRGMIRAYRFIRREENYPEVMAIVRRHVGDPNLGMPPSITDDFLRNFYFGFKQMPLDGSSSIASVQRYIDEEAVEGRVPQSLRADDVTDFGAVAAAAREIDTRYGASAYA